jgi:hypothetical protein
MRTAILIPALLAFALAGGCKGDADNQRWQAAEKETKGKPAVANDAVEGGSLNRFFPKEGEGDFSITFKQEKDGFAMASVSHDSVEQATISLTDLKGQDDAVDKFSGAPMKIAGHPAMADGSKGTKALVAGRFQVSVRSSADTFTEEDRKTWIESFDLAGLEAMN